MRSLGAGARSVNAMGVGCANSEESKFEALYNEEEHFLANQGGGYRSNYPSGVLVVQDELWEVLRKKEIDEQNGPVGAPEKRSATPTQTAIGLKKTLRERKTQVGDEREQLALRRTIPRSSTISPNDSKRKDVEGKSRTAMNQTKGQITELKCGVGLKRVDWRAKCPVGDSPKRSASPTQTAVGLKTFLKLESVKLNDPKSKLINRRPGR
uniref:Uncharacterized protein n=1 Tax=Solanum tuberosum TaxID=4113 RepID=M1DHC2_SOLTU